MKLNHYGFTLVELIAVVILLALIMLLVVPNLNNLLNSNRKKQYTAYEDMMVEYTKTYSGYKSKSYICLKDLKMKNIGSDTTCNGYVIINNSKITPYLSCMQNKKTIYQTDGYSLPSGC